MGTDITAEWPDIEWDKWYCCTLDGYRGPDAPDGCSNPYLETTQCCVIGQDIKNFLENFECDWNFMLCIEPVETSQRLTNVVGPYDTEQLCQIPCPHGPV